MCLVVKAKEYGQPQQAILILAVKRDSSGLVWDENIYVCIFALGATNQSDLLAFSESDPVRFFLQLS